MSHMAVSSIPWSAWATGETSKAAISPKVPPVGIKAAPSARVNFAPKAAAAPAPPSLVQLPPRPKIALVQPASLAARSSSPTP